MGGQTGNARPRGGVARVAVHWPPVASQPRMSPNPASASDRHHHVGSRISATTSARSVPPSLPAAPPTWRVSISLADYHALIKVRSGARAALDAGNRRRVARVRLDRQVGSTGRALPEIPELLLHLVAGKACSIVRMRTRQRSTQSSRTGRRRCGHHRRLFMIRADGADICCSTRTACRWAATRCSTREARDFGQRFNHLYANTSTCRSGGRRTRGPRCPAWTAAR